MADCRLGLQLRRDMRSVSVATEGNQSSSPEEADRVRDLVKEILASGTTWIDKHGVEKAITFQDILIAPLLNEFDALLGVRVTKSAGYNRMRPSLLRDAATQTDYRCSFENSAGVAAFLNDRALYPHLVGVQPNLYKRASISLTSNARRI